MFNHRMFAFENSSKRQVKDDLILSYLTLLRYIDRIIRILEKGEKK